MVTRDEARAKLEAERNVWNDLVTEVGSVRVSQPGVAGDWTFKDVVAHLNGWREQTLQNLEAQLAGGDSAPPPWPEELGRGGDDEGVEKINQWMYETNKDLPLTRALSDADLGFDRLRTIVSSVSEEELNDPGRFPYLKGASLGAAITGDSGDLFSHFHEEHEAGIRAWIAKT